jgi:hypothetical protein
MLDIFMFVNNVKKYIYIFMFRKEKRVFIYFRNSDFLLAGASKGKSREFSSFSFSSNILLDIQIKMLTIFTGLSNYIMFFLFLVGYLLL